MEGKNVDYNPIKALRIMLGLTQKKLSEACFDIPIRTIQDWEGGRRTPPLYIVMLITSHLDSIGLLDKNNRKENENDKNRN